MRTGKPKAESTPARFQAARQDYDAAKETRFTRKRTGVGSGSGDSHFRNESEYIKVMERARELCRNFWFGKRALDLAVQLEVGSEGPAYQPKTGDKKLDGELSERWRKHATDPTRFDAQERFTFAGQLEQVARAYKRDGDMLAWLMDSGAAELIEGHRLRSPTRARKRKDGSRVAFGVLQGPAREHREYWVKPDNNFKAPAKVGEVTKLPRFDREGHVIATLVQDPDRISQTRGVTAFKAVIDKAGFSDDLEFAHLVQAQMTAAFAMARKRGERAGSDLNFGSRETNTRDDGSKETLEGVSPGMFLNLEHDETLEGFSPNVPNPEFFNHIKLVIQEMSVTLYLPLVMLLMDASETNFSGYRAAFQQAQDAAMRNRGQILEPQYCRPVLHNWVRAEMVRDPAIARTANKSRVDPFAHDWKWPRWKSIQPKDDAQADRLRLEDNQASPRMVAAEKGIDIDDLQNEVVEDNKNAIRLAAQAAGELNSEFGLSLGYKDVLFLQSEKITNTLTGGNDVRQGGAVAVPE